MLTKQQLEELAEFYQIDQFTTFREYLQLLFLNYLYQQKEAGKIYFKGGTAIHFLFNSPRFSEDLDFSTAYNRRQIKDIVQQTAKAMVKELAETKISFLYSGRQSIRFRLKYQAPDFKYPFVIRLDFTVKEKQSRVSTTTLATKFPLSFFPIITHFSPEEILAEKIRALVMRGKGRDLFDLWFLLTKGVRLDRGLVARKLRVMSRKWDEAGLVKKIKNFPEKKLDLDLNQFLPGSQRKIISRLKEDLITQLLS